MPFKHKDLHMKNEEGSGLILALMTLMVLSVLGTSLGAITIGSYKLGDINRDDTSAYYIAEAGANMAYEEIKNGVLVAYENNNTQVPFFDSQGGIKGVNDSINGKVYSSDYFENQFGDQPTANVIIKEIAGTNPREYIIRSTGMISGISRIVEKSLEITWVDKDAGIIFPKIPENAVIIGNNQVNIGGNKVVGNILINSTANKSVSLSYTDVSEAVFYYKPGINPNQLIDYPNWNKPVTQVMQENIEWQDYNLLVETFPSIPSYSFIDDSNDILLDGGGPPSIVNLNGNTSFKSIELDSNRTLQFNIGSNDISITIDNLKLNNGHIKVIGDGYLTIYVKNSISFGSSSSINVDSDSSKVSIYYAGSSSLNLSGGQRINGSLFLKQADLYMENGSGVNGTILSGGSKVYLDGGTFASPLIIAPKASVDIRAGAQYNGIILGGEIDLSGGAIIIYKAYNAQNNPFDNVETNTNVDNDLSNSQIISTKPSLEME